MVIRIPNPDGRGQRRRKTDRPVVAEVLRRPRLGTHVPAGEGQVAAATKRHATVAVVRHDRIDDERHLRADRLELVLGRVVLEDGLAESVLDAQHRGRPVADAHVRQRRGARDHVQR